jgi:hypothetical protein
VSGPGTVDLSWSGKAGTDTLDIKTAMARLAATARIQLDPVAPGATARALRSPAANVQLQMPRRVMDRALAGADPQAADWTDATIVPITASLSGVQASADRRSVDGRGIDRRLHGTTDRSVVARPRQDTADGGDRVA